MILAMYSTAGSTPLHETRHPLQRTCAQIDTQKFGGCGFLQTPTSCHLVGTPCCTISTGLLQHRNQWFVEREERLTLHQGRMADRAMPLAGGCPLLSQPHQSKTKRVKRVERDNIISHSSQAVVTGTKGTAPGRARHLLP